MVRRRLTESNNLPLDEHSFASEAFLDWLVQTPAHMKLIPHAYSVAEEAQLKLNEELRLACKKIRSSYLGKSMLLAAENYSLLAMMAENGIPAIPMKGPVLAERLYGGLHHRPFSDIDVLVPPGSIDDARSLLDSAGYNDRSQNQRMFHLEFFRESKSGVQVAVELHRSLIGYAVGGDHLAFGLAGSRGFTEHCWDRAQKNGLYWQMKPCDEFLYLCLHLVTHILMERQAARLGAACNSLMLARDIYLAVSSWGDQINWEEFLELIERFHLRVPVSLALGLSFRWFQCENLQLQRLAGSVSRRQAQQYILWAENPSSVRKPLLKLPQRLLMIGHAFGMADRWSDRFQVLPLASREFFSRWIENSCKK